MKIILAESGNEFELKHSTKSHFSGSVNEIKLEIEKRVNTKASDQILITANGIQLKENDKQITDNNSVLVVFNRRLLQQDVCMDRLFNSIPSVTESLIDSKTIPHLKELENVIYLYQAQEREQELFDTLHHIIQVCVQASNHRYAIINQFSREVNAQAISIDAALSNLESHVRTAYQNIGKFDRIAQREFAKHAIAITSIDLDIELLQNIQLHPRVVYHISNSNQLDHTILSTFVPVKELLKAKQDILKKYDALVSATLEQKNKVVYLHNQTTHVSTTRTMSEIVIQRVSNIKSEVDRFKIALEEIHEEIYQELKKRRKRAAVAEKKQQPPFLVDDHSPPSSPSPPLPRSSSSATDIVHHHQHDISINYPLSPPTPQQQRKQKNSTQNILRDAIRSLYLNETLIHQAEKSVHKEKQTSVTYFIRCMQSISQVEESVTKIYPRLAELEKEIKMLRIEIEKGQGALAKKMIAGYGMLLIELWRRDKYTEIVKGNANLLHHLFDEFKKLEQTYRKDFEKEIVCLDSSQSAEENSSNHHHHQEAIVAAAAILPFQMSNINDPPIIFQTFFEQAVTSSESVQQEEMDTQLDIVTRRQVEDYIQLVHSFYISNNNSSIMSNNTENKPSNSRESDVSVTLVRHLERETKRIRSGLVQLGLPGSSNNHPITTSQDGNNIASSVSSNNSSSSTDTIKDHQTTPLSPSTTCSVSSDMKLATTTTNTTTLPMATTATTKTVLFQQQKDWEFERASILRQSEEYGKYIQDLGIKHDQEKQKYEKDKQTLLRKLYSQEKRMEQINQNHADQIQSFQIQLQNAEKVQKMKEMEWKQQQAKALQNEQEKFDKRLNGFHQRMNAKDEEFARILLQEKRLTKSAPSSPTSSTFLSEKTQSNVCERLMVTIEQYDADIQQLQDKMKELVDMHQLEIERIHQEKKELTVPVIQQEPPPTSLSTTDNTQNVEHLRALVTCLQADHTKEVNSYQQVIDQLRTELEETREKHRLKILQMTENNTGSEARLKSLFLNENQQLTMQCEARIANLVAEHEDHLKELEETFENEKSVQYIQYQTELEQQQVKWDKAWRDKLEKEKQQYKKDLGIKLRELANLQQEQRAIKRIAKDVLSITTYETNTVDDNDISLVDLLRKTLTNVSSLQSQRHEDSVVKENILFFWT